jgi:REP element-mobilizing transposase RayT
MLHWLLTVTTYGTWLPGDPRGSVTSVRDLRRGEQRTPARHEHDQFDTPFERPISGLYRSAQSNMKGRPVRLESDHARALIEQFQETAEHRSWPISAIAVMWNHFHIVLAAPRDVDRTKIRADLKAYASRKLNKLFPKPSSQEWWSDGGSCRPLKSDLAVANAVNYVLFKQFQPLVTWAPDYSGR